MLKIVSINKIQNFQNDFLKMFLYCNRLYRFLDEKCLNYSNTFKLVKFNTIPRRIELRKFNSLGISNVQRLLDYNSIIYL